MRTTLNISDDVLVAARKMAAKNGMPLGKVISDLAGQSLMTMTLKNSAQLRNGFPQMARIGKVLTSTEVATLSGND